MGRSGEICRGAWWHAVVVAGAVLLACPRGSFADEPKDSAAEPAGTTGEVGTIDSVKPAAKKLSPDPPHMKRLLPDANAWIDPKEKRVVVDGIVCLRAGTLEMFACLTGTKEHESVVAVDVPAHAIHAALLAVGAKPGSPARFQPEYRSASGTIIDINVVWLDEKKQTQTARAQEWVRNVRTGKPLSYDWVFAGSALFTDENGKEHYQAEAGDLICVSNFPDAMLDLPVASSQATGELLFEAFTDHVPAVGTKVRLVLKPRADKADKKK